MSRWWCLSTGELCIEGLRAGIPGQEILRGVTLTVRSGEVHAVMGPNGSGKSTLAHVLMGRPGYEVLDGSVTLDGIDLLALPTWQRARAGLFLGMQHPIEVPGVSLLTSLTAAGQGYRPTRHRRTRSTSGSGWPTEARRIGFDDRFLPDRSTSTFPAASGSATRRSSSVCYVPASPSWTRSIRDWTSMRWATVGRRVQEGVAEWGLGVLAITHFRRLLDVLHPDVVHVLSEGRVVATGDSGLAEIVDRTGYAAYS